MSAASAVLRGIEGIEGDQEKRRQRARQEMYDRMSVDEYSQMKVFRASAEQRSVNQESRTAGDYNRRLPVVEAQARNDLTDENTRAEMNALRIKANIPATTVETEVANAEVGKINATGNLTLARSKDYPTMAATEKQTTANALAEAESQGDYLKVKKEKGVPALKAENEALAEQEKKRQVELSLSLLNENYDWLKETSQNELTLKNFKSRDQLVDYGNARLFFDTFMVSPEYATKKHNEFMEKINAPGLTINGLWPNGKGGYWVQDKNGQEHEIEAEDIQDSLRTMKLKPESKVSGIEALRLQRDIDKDKAKEKSEQEKEISEQEKAIEKSIDSSSLIGEPFKDKVKTVKDTVRQRLKDNGKTISNNALMDILSRNAVLLNEKDFKPYLIAVDTDINALINPPEAPVDSGKPRVVSQIDRDRLSNGLISTSDIARNYGVDAANSLEKENQQPRAYEAKEDSGNSFPSQVRDRTARAIAGLTVEKIRGNEGLQPSESPTLIRDKDGNISDNSQVVSAQQNRKIFLQLKSQFDQLPVGQMKQWYRKNEPNMNERMKSYFADELQRRGIGLNSAELQRIQIFSDNHGPAYQ